MRNEPEDILAHADLIAPAESVRLEIVERREALLRLRFSGRLTAKTAGKIWSEAVDLAETTKPRELVLEVTGLDYCDMTGLSLVSELRRLQERRQGTLRVEGLKSDQKALLDLIPVTESRVTVSSPLEKPGLVERMGRRIAGFAGDVYEQIAFVGQVLAQTFLALARPKCIRWKDVWVFIEKGGADAVPLVMMAGFLIGVIMAFQSALPLKQMGSDVFVANVVAFAVLRELGPLMTAIILAGRTGSAIAAEIGTMKINEEVNALTTMGLEPVRFLVVSRMLGIVFLAPLLTVIADFFGMLGGMMVFQSFGYSAVTYVNQVTSTVDLGDVLGGIFKAVPFSIAVGGIGCLRGLQTKTGASAVGESTTSSVVTGMVMIIVLDGVISAIYFALGI